MRRNAERGVDLNSDLTNCRCGREMGWYRADQLISGKPIDLEDLWQMHSWFARHKTFKNNKAPNCGYINWLMWGGDDGQRWTKTKWKKYSKQAKEYHKVYTDNERRLRYKRNSRRDYC